MPNDPIDYILKQFLAGREYYSSEDIVKVVEEDGKFGS